MFAIMNLNCVLSQVVEEVDSNLVLMTNYEVSYYVSGGNVYSLRLLREGILIKKIIRRGKVRIKTKFIPIAKLDFKKYNAIQNYVDSSNLIEFNQAHNDSLISRIGLPSSFEIVDKADIETENINRFNNLYYDEKMKIVLF